MQATLRLFAALLFSTLHVADAADSEEVDPSKVIEKPVLADTPETFARQAAWIEAEMLVDGRYEYAKAADKQRVRVLLTQMSHLLQSSGSVAAMDNGTKIHLFND